MTVTNIRLAQQNDMDEVIPLSYTALREYGDYIAMSNDKSTTISRLKKFFNHQLKATLHISGYSVLTVNNEIAGAMTSYPGMIIPSLHENAGKIIEEFKAPRKDILRVKSFLLDFAEATYDEYYVDTLAVKNKFKGQGLASKLLFEAEKKAKELNLKKLVLLADATKPELVKFYKKNNFTIAQTLEFKDEASHEVFHKMSKNIAY